MIIELAPVFQYWTVESTQFHKYILLAPVSDTFVPLEPLAGLRVSL